MTPAEKFALTVTSTTYEPGYDAHYLSKVDYDLWLGPAPYRPFHGSLIKGGFRPYRVHVRDPSFANLQALPLMVEGGLVADVVACIASVDPVMGGVDR